MRTIVRIMCVSLLTACGGAGDDTKPAQAPAAPTVAPAVPEPLPSAPVASSVTPTEMPKPSMADMQKGLVQAVADAINGHDAAKLADLYTNDAALKVAGAPDVTGRDNIQKDSSTWMAAFPNAKFGIKRAWAKNDVVVSEWALTATHSGEYMGIKATEKPVGFTGLTVSWLSAAGKVKEEHRYFDGVTIFAQLGLGPKGKKTRPIPQMPASIEWHWAKGTPDEDKNADAVKLMQASFEKKDEAAFLAGVAETIEWDDLTMPGPSKGKGEAKKFFVEMTTAFPDIKVASNNAWGIEDFAISEGTMSGTNKGPLMNTPPTKKSATMHGVDVVQLQDGKAIKGWSYGNGAELLSQLGLLKVPVPATAKPPGAAAPAKPTPKPAPTKPAAPPKK